MIRVDKITYSSCSITLSTPKKKVHYNILRIITRLPVILESGSGICIWISQIDFNVEDPFLHWNFINSAYCL